MTDIKKDEIKINIIMCWVMLLNEHLGVDNNVFNEAVGRI